MSTRMIICTPHERMVEAWICNQSRTLHVVRYPPNKQTNWQSGRPLPSPVPVLTQTQRSMCRQRYSLSEERRGEERKGKERRRKERRGKEEKGKEVREIGPKGFFTFQKERATTDIARSP